MKYLRLSTILLLLGSGCVPMSKYQALQQELETQRYLTLEGKASVYAYRQRLEMAQNEHQALVQEVKVYETKYKSSRSKDWQIQQLQARIQELERELKQLKGNKKAVYNKEVEKKQKSSY
ncbi:MAG: hypothetical protein KatS3mg033_2126 [Thermonema sp.]|jgi:chromosome segregation ATPase|uniref:hypothetical protein n=1 Tax=Thermonema TaxID=28194 RepID=UPI00056F27EB|nr:MULTISPECIES: hypothetical protein [Thermonema]GIV40326.1 MAG: hypothetical protein KatS3mg033_2126 [Thermonema sp.]